MSVVSSSSWINEVYRLDTVHVQTSDIQQDVYKNVVFSLLLCHAPIFFFTFPLPRGVKKCLGYPFSARKEAALRALRQWSSFACQPNK